MEHTISASDVREICGLSDYASRPVLNDPALKPIKCSGPKGGNGLRHYRLRNLLSVLRTCAFFTSTMEQALCDLDQAQRNQQHA